MLNADKYLPVDATLIPTGELAKVAGTPFDFTRPHAIRQFIGQVKGDPPGYDHCFVLRQNDDQLSLQPASVTRVVAGSWKFVQRSLRSSSIQEIFLTAKSPMQAINATMRSA